MARSQNKILMVLVLCMLMRERSVFGSDDDTHTRDTVDMAVDCSKDQNFYYVTATGTGESKDMATQVALINARKNALMCIFGGKINYQSTTDESNQDVSTKTSTSVEVSADQMNWSGFEMAASSDTETEGNWVVKTKFRWSHKDIAENKKRNDALKKEREKNRAIAARAEANRKLAEERKALIEQQRAELESLKRQERELAEVASEYDRALKTLKKLKKQEQSKDQKWIRMVVQFGCGVTLTDVKDVLGPPDEIKVYGTRKHDYDDYKPLLYFIYGKYALVAPVHDTTFGVTDHNWDRVKHDASRYQITYVEQFVGGTSAWWICRKV